MTQCLWRSCRPPMGMRSPRLARKVIAPSPSRALILAEIMRGAGLEETAARQINAFGDETRSAILRAPEAPRDGAAETVESVGGGWVAEEALSIALHACLCARDFERGLLIAATHGGDSDSTGAIAGCKADRLRGELIDKEPRTVLEVMQKARQDAGRSSPACCHTRCRDALGFFIHDG